MDARKIRGKTAAQIAESIEQGVRSGSLRPGGLLPTIRDLSEVLGVNRNTVSSAYKILARTGLLLTDGRRGTRISESAHYTVELGDFRSLIDVSLGNPDIKLLPATPPGAFQPMSQRRLYYDRHENPALMDVIRTKLVSDQIPADHVSFCQGAFSAIHTILATLGSERGPVAVEDPCFMTTLHLLTEMGFETIPMETDAHGVTPEALKAALERGCAAVVLTPYAHNPTGAAWTSERTAQIEKLLRRHPKTLVIEDDHFSALATDRFESIGRLGLKRWVVVRSVSKFLGPDFRFAYAAGDDLTISRIRTRNAITFRAISASIQEELTALLTDRTAIETVRRAAREYAARRAKFRDALASHGISSLGDTGFNIWVPTEDETSVSQYLLENGWRVIHGAIFRIVSRPGIRITVSALDDAQSKTLAACVAAATRAGSGVRLAG